MSERVIFSHAESLFINASKLFPAVAIAQAGYIAQECNNEKLDPLQLLGTIDEDSIAKILQVANAMHSGHNTNKKDIGTLNTKRVKGIVYYDYRIANELKILRQEDFDYLLKALPQSHLSAPNRDVETYWNKAIQMLGYSILSQIDRISDEIKAELTLV